MADPTKPLRDRPDHTPNGKFAPGNKARAHATKGLAATVREIVGDLRVQITHMAAIANGEVKGAAVRDRIEATKWLADRGWGKALDTTLQVQGELEHLGEGLDVAREQISDLARHLKSLKTPSEGTADPSAERDPGQGTKAA